MRSAREPWISAAVWAPLDAGRAQALAERLHRGHRDAGGAPLIDHVRRVAVAVLPDARVVAWLHEVLEHTSISEETLLAEGLSTDELRALRLLSRDTSSRSNTSYLAHVQLIAAAAGAGGQIARSVKRADLADRAVHPATRDDGWSPPYELALEILGRPAFPRSYELSIAPPPTAAETTPARDAGGPLRAG